MLKKCSKCGELKPLTEYTRSPQGAGGLRSNCKICDRLRCAEWKTNNPDKVQATNQKRHRKRLAEPEKEMVRRARCRSKISGIECSITEQDVHIPLLCPVFKIPMVVSNSRSVNRNAPSLDRIDVNYGYIPGNVQVISYKANTMKSDATSEELQLFALWILENMQLDTETINKLKELNDKYRVH